MKRVLPFSFLVLLFLLLINSSIVLGNDYSLAGDCSSLRYNIKFESFKYDPFVMYIDYFKFQDSNSTYNTTILGVEYFPIDFPEHYGFYIGTGIPLYRAYDNYSYSQLEWILGPAFESGVELRGGIRIKPLEYLPFIDLGYSNIKKMYLDLGFNF